MKFNGYKRPDGHVGIRNHVVIMPGVICAAGVAQKIANKVDGIQYLYNPNGCAQNSRDTAVTLNILSGLIANGNVYGVLIVGLGCEMIREATYLEAIRKKTNKPVYYISIQEEGGIQKTVAKGVEIVKALSEEASKCVREECDLSDIILGLECGGSDPTSGFSANAVLGNTSDRLVDLNGTSVLCETPEAIGAEHILKERALTPEIGQKLCDTVLKYEKMFADMGEDIRNTNPSPGNKASGITTLEEKSLGCVHKSGTKPFSGVYEYGQMIDKKGLVFMDGTAYDVASVVSLIAGGAQIVAFTTGMGTPVGNAIAPVVKITGNHDTAVRLNDMIDFDTSDSVTGAKSVEELGEELLSYIVQVCNGKNVKAEDNEISDMAINQFNSYA
ncbi:MAG: carbohydrate hydrolase [Clostridia bacterium BRH_c25]|nr:MAG: carbohydrate hydrolase [Clostridia bacterium BRH_c25]